MLTIEDCKKYDQLTFAWNCDLIGIEYMDQNIVTIPVPINPKHEMVSFQWKVSPEMLKSIRWGGSGKCFFSEQAFGKGNNFALYLELTAESALLYVQVLRLPHHYKCLVADIIMELTTAEGESVAYYEMTKEISAHYQSNTRWPDGTLKRSRLIKMSSMIFTIEMTIISVILENMENLSYSM